MCYLFKDTKLCSIHTHQDGIILLIIITLCLFINGAGPVRPMGGSNASYGGGGGSNVSYMRVKCVLNGVQYVL